MPSNLICPACETVYEAGPDEPWRCPCGRALEFVDQPMPQGNPLPLSRLDTSEGLWTFFEFLPIEPHVTFYEGFTPLVEADEWSAAFKLEYVFPTGSFKDRGATTTLSRAVELGVEKVLEDSSGNAGAAIATYAARAGVEADIYVPADVKQSKLMTIQRADARPVRIEGSRQDVTDACIEAVEGGGGWYASHAWNPAFYAGTMTIAFEIAAQRHWTVPDAVVLPIGHGTLFLGAYRGFSLLNEAGIVDGMPRLLGAQARGHAPIVDALAGADEDAGGAEDVDGADGAEDGPRATNDATAVKDRRRERKRTSDIADGIQISLPARKDELLEAIDETNGDAIALGDDPIEATLDRLHRNGFYVEPTSAVAPAALEQYREDGVLDTNDDVVVPLTGSGLKTL